jgi:hypothetical protein
VRPIGLAVLLASAVAVAGCTQSSGPGEEEPPDAEQGLAPPVTESMASLEERGGRTRLETPVYEVAHLVDTYRHHTRPLPVLVSRTPAPHPRKGRPYFARGHGVETHIRPRLKQTAPEDGFQWSIWWRSAFDGTGIPSVTVDLVATLADTRFRFENASGQVWELRPSSVNRPFGVDKMLFVMSSEGLELREGDVDRFGGPPRGGPLMLPWAGGRRAELDRPGRWRIQMVGNLHFFDRGPLPFESSWVEFQREPSSSSVLPLAEVPDRAIQILERLGPLDPPASFRELLGENDAGNRVAVFDRGGIDEWWVLRTSLVELSPSGELIAIWRDKRDTCVAEGTMIETSRGTLPIEQVSVGDRVLSYDTQLSKEVWSEVRWVHAGQARELLVVDGELELTGSHPLWIDGAWREARELQRGSEVMKIDRQPEPVASVATKLVDSPVYDLTVDYPHNYFADGFLVHNKSLLISFSPTWKYDPRLHRPEALLKVIEPAREPIMECLREQEADLSRYGIESFILEVESGDARLIVLRPNAIEAHHQLTGGRIVAGGTVEGCATSVFENFPTMHAFPPGVPARFYRFRIEGDGPPVESVAELDVETMRDGFVGRGPSVAQCFIELAERSDSLKHAFKAGSTVTLEVNFRALYDAVTVVRLRGPAGVPADGLEPGDYPSFDACVEEAVHPSWFEGVPPKCETVITSTYRLKKTKGSWTARWKLVDVGPSDEESSNRWLCTSARPGPLKLRRALRH